MSATAAASGESRRRDPSNTAIPVNTKVIERAPYARIGRVLVKRSTIQRRGLRRAGNPISSAIHGYGTDFNVYETAAEGLRRQVIPQVSAMVMYAVCTRLGSWPP
jgi:hypothetical protein